MVVYRDSRYAPSLLLRVQDTRNGADVERSFLYTDDQVASTVPIQTIYSVVAGERLDQIAYKFGGNSQLWWVIADVNQIVEFPLFIEAGTRLKIPTQEVFRQAAARGT